jgi:hypothetical protein
MPTAEVVHQHCFETYLPEQRQRIINAMGSTTMNTKTIPISIKNAPP